MSYKIHRNHRLRWFDGRLWSWIFYLSYFVVYWNILVFICLPLLVIALGCPEKAWPCEVVLQLKQSLKRGQTKAICWQHFQHLGNTFFLEGQLDGTSSLPSQSSPCDPQIHFLKYFGGVAPTGFKWASLSGVKVVNERYSQCQRWSWHCNILIISFLHCVT